MLIFFIIYNGCELPMSEDFINLDENEVLDLETLIVDGANARIPIEITVPVYKDGVMSHAKYGAVIRPLPSYEFTNAAKIGLKDDYTDVNTEIVKRGLCTKNGDDIPEDFVRKLPVGVVVKLAEKICEVSGVEQDKSNQEKLARQVMGF